MLKTTSAVFIANGAEDSIASDAGNSASVRKSRKSAISLNSLHYRIGSLLLDFSVRFKAGRG
jgi:hypothetical protein